MSKKKYRKEAEVQESLQPETEEVSEQLVEEEADAPVPNEILEEVLKLENPPPVQKFTLEDVASQHVKNWKPQWLPGLRAHASFHGVQAEDTDEKIRAIIASYGLQLK